MKNGLVRVPGGFQIYKDDLFHCEDGPALEYSEKISGGNETIREWWLDGMKHREDGPAFIHKKGNRFLVKEWWIHGREHTKEEFHQWLKKKALNEKLQSTLKPRHKDKKKKI